MSSIVKEIEPNVENLLGELGYELYDMELSYEGDNSFLRIYIESTTDANIMIEDCMKANSVITKYLNQEDPIKDAYMLEVSSPGIIRKLKKASHFKRVINKEISIKTKQRIEGLESKKHIGKLEEVVEDGIVIDGLKINFNELTSAETTFKF